MKTLAPGLQDHLDTRSTTMALCWKVTRRDGLVQGFTEHDDDLTFDDVTFLASSGFSSSRIQQSLGLNPDNLNVEGALSSDTINENDLAAGLYDNAKVVLYWVNWEDTAERVVMETGNIGEVARKETAFSAEFRSMLHKLNQRGGRVYQRTCDAVLGDARCGVNLALPANKGVGLVTAVNRRKVLVSGLGSFPVGHFTYGLLTFTSGANAGLSFEVKSNVRTSVVLWELPPFAVAVGDAVSVTAGCAKDAAACSGKFSNIVNFRGFPHIPGNDVISEYPRDDAEEMDGGSWFA